MEDSKLQALHDSLSKLRGHQGLGSRGAYSWQKKSAGTQEGGKGPAEFGLPANALYANFLPAGTYDPKAGKAHDGDGRAIKRDFSDDDDSSSSSDDNDDEETKKRKRKEKKKAKKMH